MRKSPKIYKPTIIVCDCFSFKAVSFAHKSIIKNFTVKPIKIYIIYMYFSILIAITTHTTNFNSTLKIYTFKKISRHIY